MFGFCLISGFEGIDYNCWMESTNRSGLQCFEHPREEITNFCINVDCLKPLCPDCVEVHTKVHHKQEILSWKHCLSETAMKMKTTLDELRALYDSHRQLKGPKTTDTVEAESKGTVKQISSG